ncbi:hypothetical protein E8E13_005324 [Curvularia kusanoi]|uniref:DUF4345 domain-containing protein n=1 Tax=Curvularia kusanoi TaxID=90978 RepID=A0A9P4WDV5_CURKU|nr:hypothetical protein E8E13_005324 [Curvularia kusanoi]
MSRISQAARFLLALYGLINIAQGLYSITNPQGWTHLAGANFAGSPAHAVQAIGLGALGVGWYQFIFACQNNQPLLAATVPLRIVYGAIIAKSGGDRKVVMYETVVWALAMVAAWPEILGGQRHSSLT